MCIVVYCAYTAIASVLNTRFYIHNYGCASVNFVENLNAISE